MCLSDYIQLIGLILTPLIIYFSTIWYQNRKQKRDEKMKLFLTLMAQRYQMARSPAWVDALNTIQVVFSDNDKVLKAWDDYYRSLFKESPNKSISESLLLELLKKMAHSLGYTKLDIQDLSNKYNPEYYASQIITQDTLIKELLRVLKNSKSFAETKPEDDFPLEGW